ncbi:hypothetical protein CAPN001_11540 [Capnocytophaga stomatis]|nr:hypothetical protein CAPN001_11540 [Capnocytophaga stomatis]
MNLEMFLWIVYLSSSVFAFLIMLSCFLADDKYQKDSFSKRILCFVTLIVLVWIPLLNVMSTVDMLKNFLKEK